MTRARHCGTKIRHYSRQAAFEHRDRVVAEFGTAEVSLNVYRCRFCSGHGRTVWHVGHKSWARHP